ncbi:hypothetical protein B0T22DRAFT_367980 [Podospora appendiculata]|uniref:F-box domain-containing protein n=1 Tax=Podospora appendiculata TaxID=314037 RepID=A0AAE1CG15_9PEZI|nr:hypothetical protein B0T22DRAFT_367980 [Podospora appendiculata]
MPSKHGGTVSRFQPFRRCANRPPRFYFFHRLPVELRTMIYRELLLLHEAVDVCGIWNTPPFIDTGLFRTCREISAEASQFFYGANTFSFLENCDDFHEDDNDLNQNESRAWLLSIGAKNALAVRNLQLRVRNERPEAYYVSLLHDLAGRMPNLTRLALVAERHKMRKVLDASEPLGFYHVWAPNHVLGFSKSKVQDLLQVLPSAFRLSIVVLVEEEDKLDDKMAKICSDLRCRVMVVDPETARRDMDDSRVLWTQKTLFDGSAEYLPSQPLLLSAPCGKSGTTKETSASGSIIGNAA